MPHLVSSNHDDAKFSVAPPIYGKENGKFLEFPKVPKQPPAASRKLDKILYTLISDPCRDTFSVDKTV